MYANPNPSTAPQATPPSTPDTSEIGLISPSSLTISGENFKAEPASEIDEEIPMASFLQRRDVSFFKDN